MTAGSSRPATIHVQTAGTEPPPPPTYPPTPTPTPTWMSMKGSASGLGAGMPRACEGRRAEGRGTARQMAAVAAVCGCDSFCNSFPSRCTLHASGCKSHPPSPPPPPSAAPHPTCISWTSGSGRSWLRSTRLERQLALCTASCGGGGGRGDRGGDCQQRKQQQMYRQGSPLKTLPSRCEPSGKKSVDWASVKSPPPAHLLTH